MNSSELKGSRFDLAMERLRDGHQINYGTVGFVLAPDGFLTGVIPSAWGPEYVTTERAEDDFSRADATLKDVLDASAEFRKVIGPRRIRYELICDYGMGGILLCTKNDEGLHLAEGYPEQSS